MTPTDPSLIRRKLAVIVDNLQALGAVVSMPLEAYRRDLFLRKGTERLLQEVIEAAIDVNTHLVTQERATLPDDYYQGFLALADFGVLPRDLATAIAPSAGLRNRLVHEYDAIVDALVLDGIRKAQMLFPKYVAAIEAYLKKKEG